MMTSEWLVKEPPSVVPLKKTTPMIQRIFGWFGITVRPEQVIRPGDTMKLSVALLGEIQALPHEESYTVVVDKITTEDGAKRLYVIRPKEPRTISLDN